MLINSLTTKKADNKMFVCKFSKNVKSKLYQTENSKTRGQTVDLKKVAPYLRCLQIRLLSSLILKENTNWA